MAIVRKVKISKYIEELNVRFEKLKSAINGTSPNPNIYNLYHSSPEQYAKEFIEITELDVKLAIEDFNTILSTLKSVKSLQEPKLKGKA